MNHKYGFHTNRTGNDLLDAIKRIRPRVIKALDHDVGFWTEVRTLLPEVFLIGRVSVAREEQDQFASDPSGKGRAFAERVLSLEANRTTVGGRRLFDAWESYNEVLAGDASTDLKCAYDDFQVAFAAPIKQAGLEPVAMNFGTGNMLGQDFLTFFPGTLATHTYLGFHEYDWPDLWRLHEQNIREKNEGGMWLALRYRRIMNDVRQIYGNKHKVLITECGLTQGVLGGDDVGWRHPLTLPPQALQDLQSRNIDPQPTEERYWQSLKWYNGELMKDNYVVAAQLFVVGAVHPWESFEHLGGLIDRLEAFQSSEPEQPQPSLQQVLLDGAARAQAIRFNPRAVLQKRIFAEGYVPNSPEFEVGFGGARYVAQRAEHLGTGEVRVYYARKGDWDQVAFIRRGEGDEIIHT